MLLWLSIVSVAVSSVSSDFGEKDAMSSNASILLMDVAED